MIRVGGSFRESEDNDAEGEGDRKEGGTRETGYRQGQGSGSPVERWIGCVRLEYKSGVCVCVCRDWGGCVGMSKAERKV